MEALAGAPATFGLLVVNVAVSLYVLLARPDLMEQLSLRPYDVVHGRDYGRLVTGSFVHAGIGHLFFNMFTLYSFGTYMEAQLGPVRFLLVYFGAELLASGYSILRHRNDPGYAAVGASGAVSGVIFAFCLYQPFARLGVLFVIPMPAIVFAVVYVLGSIYAMRQSQQGGLTGGIAHEAHLGGALGGVLLTLLLDPRSGGIFLRQIGLLG